MKGRKLKNRKQKSVQRNPIFDSIQQGLLEAINHAKGNLSEAIFYQSKQI